MKNCTNCKNACIIEIIGYGGCKTIKKNCKIENSENCFNNEKLLFYKKGIPEFLTKRN